MANKESVVFTGSMMDGIDGNLVTWCGLPPLTDEQWDKVWGQTSEYSILSECSNAFIETTPDYDEVPGYTDEFYDVITNDVDGLKREVRQIIQRLLDG